MKDTPKQVSSLPTKAKKIFVSAFNNSYNKVGEEKAFKIAWGAVRKAYTKSGGKWVSKKGSKIKNVKVKGGLFGLSSYADRVISSSAYDADGEEVDPNLLVKLYQNNLIEQEGDLEHLNAEGLGIYKGLFKLRKAELKDNKLFGRFYLDKTHPKYKEYIENFDNKMVGISAEFYNPQFEGNRIVDADRLGWSFHSNPKNPDARIAM